MATKLPPLPNVEVLSPLVIRILGGNPGKFTLQGTNTYLIGSGPERILIDTGEGLPTWRASLASVLSTQSCTIATTLLTHWHHDHVNGVPDLLSLCPDTTIYKTPFPTTSASYPSPPSPYIPSLPTLPASKVYLSIAPNQSFSVPGVTLTAVPSPGHTIDHTAFVLVEEANALFAGDAVLGHGTAVFEDLTIYLSSLSALQSACGADARLYPGHGEVVKDGRTKVAEYIAHRKRRETEVLEVLKTEETRGWTSMDVVKIVYKDVPEALHLPAEGGVRQVLVKLNREGRVREEGGRWWMGGKSAL